VTNGDNGPEAAPLVPAMPTQRGRVVTVVTCAHEIGSLNFFLAFSPSWTVIPHSKYAFTVTTVTNRSPHPGGASHRVATLLPPPRQSSLTHQRGACLAAHPSSAQWPQPGWYWRCQL